MDGLVSEKILKFETYVNNVLREDLGKLAKRLDIKNDELSEFLQLKSVIRTMKNTGAAENGFKTKVDMGNNFFVQAHVEDASQILMDVGLGYYVEFSLDDALILIDVRIKLLESSIRNLRTEIAKTNAHIKLILLGIGELQGMNSNV